MSQLPAGLADALHQDSAASALRVQSEEGQLGRWLPELEEGRGFRQPERHYFDVLDHNLAATECLDRALSHDEDGTELRGVMSWLDVDEALDGMVGGLPLRSLLRLAALVHDIAKPRSATITEEGLRFPRHGPQGADLLAERLPALGLDEEATTFVCRMVRYHLRPAELVRNWPPTDHAMRRFSEALGGHVLPLMLVNLADGWATRGPLYQRDNYRRHCGLVNYVTARAWAATRPGEPLLVTGEELMTTLDFESGRLLGQVLLRVRDAQEAGQVRTREAALAFAREVLAGLREG